MKIMTVKDYPFLVYRETENFIVKLTFVFVDNSRKEIVMDVLKTWDSKQEDFRAVNKEVGEAIMLGMDWDLDDFVHAVQRMRKWMSKPSDVEIENMRQEEIEARKEIDEFKAELDNREVVK